MHAEDFVSHGRNNVSMKSGLEGRNNPVVKRKENTGANVSMKSGLEGRNNWVPWCACRRARSGGLNEVRPRRPEQFTPIGWGTMTSVSSQ